MLRAAALSMRIMTGCTVRVTNVHISIVFYASAVANHDSKGFSAQVARCKASGDGSCSLK